jgi:predicted nucleotidyltransferase
MYDDQIKAIARSYGITLVYLFGSEAKRGKIYFEGERITPHSFSDLDVAVAFEKALPEPMRTYGRLYREISEIFVPFNVDLLFMQEVNTLFQHEIIRGIRIYARDEFDADEFEEGILKRSEDLLFKKRMMEKEMMEAVDDGYFEFEYRPNP